MDKKKLLIVLPAFTFGGTVFSTLNMVTMLPKERYDIYILAMTHQGPVKDLYKDAILLNENFLLSSIIGKVNNCSNIFKKTFSMFIKTMGRITNKIGVDFYDICYSYVAHSLQKKYNFDIVAAAQEGAATYFVYKFNGCKRIAWFRSEYKFYTERVTVDNLSKEKKIYPHFDKIVCVSKTTRDDFINHLPNCQNNTIAIHNIQNVDNIIQRSKEKVDDNRYLTTCFTIISIGRIDPQKRFKEIPKIAFKLKKMGCKFRWYILGDGNYMNERNALYENIDLYGVTDYVFPLGSKLNPYPYIKACNLLVNTSYVEACPRVVMEAKILGKPVVCADFSSAREFTTDGFDGYVCPIDSLDSVIGPLIKDKDLYSEISENSKKFVMNNELILSQLISIL